MNNTGKQVKLEIMQEMERRLDYWKKALDFAPENESIKVEVDAYLDMMEWIRALTTCTTDGNLSGKRQEAYWLVWGGWSGNHDQRIDNARCSNCGYIHETVKGSLAKLSKFCGGCSSEMTVKEE